MCVCLSFWRKEDNLTYYIHTITPVFPEGLGRGVPMYTHGSPECFRSHVIGGEPIANNRAQILTPSCYWEFYRKTQLHFLLDPEIEPKTSSVAVALTTTRLPKQLRGFCIFFLSYFVNRKSSNNERKDCSWPRSPFYLHPCLPLSTGPINHNQNPGFAISRT